MRPGSLSLRAMSSQLQTVVSTTGRLLFFQQSILSLLHNMKNNTSEPCLRGRNCLLYIGQLPMQSSAIRSFNLQQSSKLRRADFLLSISGQENTAAPFVFPNRFIVKPNVSGTTLLVLFFKSYPKGTLDLHTSESTECKREYITRSSYPSKHGFRASYCLLVFSVTNSHLLIGPFEVLQWP